MAEAVLVVSVDFAALAEAAELCSRAGKFYLIGIGPIAVVIVGASLLPKETISLLAALLIFAPILVSLGFLSCGVFLNTIACWQFKLELPDSNLRRLYARCTHVSWLKFALCAAMLLNGGHGYIYDVSLWELLWWYVPAIILLINSVVTVILHFRGINELGEMIPSKTADKLASLYLFSGVPATLFAVIVFLLFRGNGRFSSPPMMMLAIVPFLLLPVFIAYQLAYRRLGLAFRARAEKG